MRVGGLPLDSLMTSMAVQQAALSAVPSIGEFQFPLTSLRRSSRPGPGIGAVIVSSRSLYSLPGRPPNVRSSARSIFTTSRLGRNFGCYMCHHGPADGVSVQDVKSAILVALEGVNRGIFGLTSKKKAEIEDLITSLEALNPSPRPTENLDKVKGEWRLLYSTISILGVKRTKLGLRDFITFGDFLQTIDVEKKRAVNKIGFSVAGLGMLRGALTIEASYSVASPTRVDIQFKTSSISPERLLSLFKKNYNLLLSIFNPNGWLEITYVDDTLRVGRDDKGNMFLVERI